jgi:hypothetical protein
MDKISELSRQANLMAELMDGTELEAAMRERFTDEELNAIACNQEWEIIPGVWQVGPED